ncbi:cytochrome c oxidase subunit II [Gulosibacter molinativorax]|uniref:cytochrome-c oxidase n=1 Tax=Gulosibacter molinativorax TaxID=256821 RepID=A0ABT7C6J2_9MICO|nr:cytochrome c oxidase subunit II [Gulosibacter molinativorax]MDJ1370422.1 cytochrome c oxidase subunit II [Gulosibacter molinativorax]QUY61335.1 Putative cytochrome c oxidase subunit II [Gulosibacter molinativorax]
MRLLERSNVRKNHRKKWTALSLSGVLALVLSGCTAQELNGYMPGLPGTTDVGDMTATFWVNSWVILLAIGFFVWGLIIWATVVYRRRKNETGLPVQMRYHMPIEMLFTILPIVLVGGFFAFTARDQAIIEDNYSAEDLDVHIEVYGKQWAWDFNYLDVEGSQYDGGVFYQGVQAVELRDAEGKTTGEIDYGQLPKLYVPVGANVTLDLKSRDVAHSFWVPEFNYKEDTIPGKTNQFSFVAEREGTYMGKCAELCGEFHSMMLFQVEVVSEAEYNDYIQSLRDQGNDGARGDDYNRELDNPGTSVPVIQHEEEEH